MAIVVTIDLIAMWRMKKKKKEGKQDALIKAFGVDEVLRYTNLHGKVSHKIVKHKHKKIE